jgi:hypothetical protein
MKPYRGPPIALARAGVRLIVRSFARLHEQVAKTRRSVRLIRWRVTAKDLVAQGLAPLRKLELDSDRHERDGAVYGSHLFGRP